MKLGNTALNNTDRHLLAMLAVASGVRVESIVRYTYPESKQPQKKAATYTRALRRLQRFGFVREVHGVWFITKASEP